MEDVTVDGMLRFIGVQAQSVWLRKWEAFDRKDDDGKRLYLAQVEACLGAVGFMGCLRALTDVNPEAALKYAREYWWMCEDGGAIGEMLWEWLEATGLNPRLVEQALSDDAVGRR